MSKTTTIIDCDFFNHITETSKDIKCFNDVISDLNIEPVMHEYVYNEELFSNKCAKDMVAEGLLKIEKFNEFIDDNNEREYVRYLEEFYKYANGKSVQYVNCNYRTYRKSKENLGEIHSICLALIKKYQLFLSDDYGAKSLNAIIEKKSQIRVKNIYDVFADVAIMKNKITTKESFIKVMRFKGHSKDEIKNIKNIWVGD